MRILPVTSCGLILRKERWVEVWLHAVETSTTYHDTVSCKLFFAICDDCFGM
jgi:hypothetical protein